MTGSLRVWQADREGRGKGEQYAFIAANEWVGLALSWRMAAGVGFQKEKTKGMIAGFTAGLRWDKAEMQEERVILLQWLTYCCL